MLMVTTSVRVINWVHTNGSDLREHFSFGLLSPVDITGFEDWFLVSSSSGDDADHSSGVSVDGLSNSGWEFDSGLFSVFGLSDDSGEGSGSSGELTIISVVELHVADGSTFWHFIDGQDVADGDSGFGTTVDVLSGVKTLGGDVVFGLESVLVGVSELDFGQRGASSWIMDDFSDNASDVASSLGVIEFSEPGRGHVVVVSSFVGGSLGVTLLLSSNASSHWLYKLSFTLR